MLFVIAPISMDWAQAIGYFKVRLSVGGVTERTAFLFDYRVFLIVINFIERDPTCSVSTDFSGYRAKHFTFRSKTQTDFFHLSSLDCYVGCP